MFFNMLWDMYIVLTLEDFEFANKITDKTPWRRYNPLYHIEFYLFIQSQIYVFMGHTIHAFLF